MVSCISLYLPVSVFLSVLLQAVVLCLLVYLQERVSGTIRWPDVVDSSSTCIVIRCINLLEVMSESISYLIRCGGMRAIRVLQVGYSILSVSFDDGLVKEGSVAVSFGCPILFCSLQVELFILQEQFVMLLS